MQVQIEWRHDEAKPDLFRWLGSTDADSELTFMSRKLLNF